MLGLLLAVCLSFAFAPLTAATAASDVSAPVLVSSTVTPKTFNLSTGPATVKVTLRITDATGTNAPTLSLDHATTSQSHSFGTATLISGTAKDGTWERTMTIPQGSALGQWEVTLFPLRDTLGNSGSFQTLSTITLSGTPTDTSAPVLVSSTVTPKTFNLSTGPATVKVTLRITDATGTNAPTLSLDHATTSQSHSFGTATLISGTAKDGTWERTMTIPQGSALGQWEVTLFPLRDTLGNSGSFQTLSTITLSGSLATAVPTVTGTAKAGYTLTANAGVWGPAPVTLSYQWYRSGTAIAGATGPTYKLTGSDTGKTLTVKITGAKANYITTAATSAQTAIIAPGTLNTAVPTMTGTTKAGYTLTANPGAWGPAPITLTYQWYRAGETITGATASTYKVTGSDTGKALTVKVTGAATGYTAVSKVSAATQAIASGTLATATPKITGTARIGLVLTVSPGAWGPAPVTLTYQWFRAGIAVPGATGTSYTLTAADNSKTLSVRVTGNKAGYTSASATSSPTGAVTP